MTHQKDDHMPELAQGALRLAEVESGFEAAEAFLHGAHSQKLPLHCFDGVADLFGSWIGCNGGHDVPSIKLRRRIN